MIPTIAPVQYASPGCLFTSIPTVAMLFARAGVPEGEHSPARSPGA
jgi:hypothetical protein